VQLLQKSVITYLTRFNLATHSSFQEEPEEIYFFQALTASLIS